jgi:hypothetical protein
MSTYQRALDQVKFLTGQDNLSDTDGTRLLDYAIDSYSDIVMKADGRWKFDDTSNTTHPVATTAFVSGQADYQLETNFLQIDRVEAQIDGVWRILQPIDRKDEKEPLSVAYASGAPEAYDYDGESIFVYPTPTAGTLKVFFTRPVSYVSSLSDTLTIPRIHANYLIYHAAFNLSLKTNDQNRAQLQQAMMIEEGKVKDYFTTRDESRPRRLKPKLDNVRVFKR